MPLSTNLNQEQTDFLVDLIGTLSPAKINEAIIDDIGVRSLDESGTVALMGVREEMEVPDFPSVLALGRIPQLKARMDLAKDKEGFSIHFEQKEKDGQEFITALKFKANGVKADYRTQEPSKITAPKRIVDEIVTSFMLTPNDVSELSTAVNAFGPAKNVKMEIKKGVVSMRVRDVSGDEYSCQVAKVSSEEDASHSYDAVNTINLLKLSMTNGKVEVGMGKKGILSIRKDKFTFYIIPAR
jgi:hypothetical protein